MRAAKSLGPLQVNDHTYTRVVNESVMTCEGSYLFVTALCSWAELVSSSSRHKCTGLLEAASCPSAAGHTTSTMHYQPESRQSYE
jgi:hypothetical protein